MTTRAAWGSVPTTEYRPSEATCPHCGTTLRHRTGINAATRQHANGDTERRHRCPKCGGAFRSVERARAKHVH